MASKSTESNLLNYHHTLNVDHQVQRILEKHGVNANSNARNVLKRTISEETYDFLDDIPQLNQEQLEALLNPRAENVYSEVLYSILNGSDISHIDQAFDYFKRVFQFDNDKHEELLANIRERDPSDVSFQLGVLGARISKIQYETLLRIVVEHEIRYDENWRGLLPEYLFRQFAAHRGLCQSVRDVCSWSVYSSALHKRTLDFTELLALIERLRRTLNDGKHEEEELINMFWTATDSFIEAALSAIHRLRINSDLNTKPQQISSLLKCLKELQLMWPTRAGLSDIEIRIKEAITEGTVDWYSQLVREQKGENADCDIDLLKNNIRISRELVIDLENMLSVHEPIFQSVWEISAFSLIFMYYDGKLNEITKPLVCGICQSLKSTEVSKEQIISTALNETSNEFDTKDYKQVDDISTQLYKETTLFELYLCLQQFHKLSNSLPQSEKDGVKLALFYTWFETAVDCWLDKVLKEALIRIGKAVSLDNLETVDSMVTYSNSAVDTMTTFYNIKASWEQLSLPEVKSSLQYVIKVVEDVKQLSLFYADAIKLKLKQTYSGSPFEFFISPTICVAINSILHVQQSLKPWAEEIGYVNRQLEDPSTNPVQDLLTDNAFKDINEKLDEIYIGITRKFEIEVFKLINKVMDTGFGVRETDELNSYICDQLLTLDSHLPQDVFFRVFSIISNHIKQRFINDVKYEVQKQLEPAYFRQRKELLNILVNCFRNPYAEQDEAIQDDFLTKIELLLNLHSMETNRLIHLYRFERTKRTKEQDVDFGSLAVRAIFIDDVLKVDVLNARNLTRIKTVESVDQETGDIKTKERKKSKSVNPFVKVTLLPTHLFSDVATQKSKVHKNTFFPLFEGSFNFLVPKSLQTNVECYILFTVKDKNLIGTNEFLGDTFLSFLKVPRSGTDIETNELDQTILPLTKLPEIDSEYLNVLKGRIWDKTARDFIKKEKKRVK